MCISAEIHLAEVIEIPVVSVSALTNHSAMAWRRGSASIHKVHTNTPLLVTKAMRKWRQNKAVSLDGIIIHIGRGMENVAKIATLLDIQ